MHKYTYSSFTHTHTHTHKVLVMDQSDTDTRLGEMTVELEELSAICRDEPDPTNAINLAVS